jgi:uncharacterized protein YuzE
VELSNVSTVRYSYDSESDCGYIRIADGDVASTESLTASVHVDRDGSDNIVGIEVLTVTDPGWMPRVRDLLAGSVPDASLVSARFQDMVAARRHGSETAVSAGSAGSRAQGTAGDTQVA